MHLTQRVSCGAAHSLLGRAQTADSWNTKGSWTVRNGAEAMTGTEFSSFVKFLSH